MDSGSENKTLLRLITGTLELSSIDIKILSQNYELIISRAVTTLLRCEQWLKLNDKKLNLV